MTKKNNVAISHLIRSFFAFAMLLACVYPLTAQRITYKKERELQNRLQCANLSLLQNEDQMALHLYNDVREEGGYSQTAFIANDSLAKRSYLNKNLEALYQCIKYSEKYLERNPTHERLQAKNEKYWRFYNDVRNNLVMQEDLCGIWVSDYAEDKHKAPYLILEIEKVGDNYIAHLHPTCEVTWKYPTYQYLGKYNYFEMTQLPRTHCGIIWKTKSVSAHFADKLFKKAHPQTAGLVSDIGKKFIDMGHEFYINATSDPDFRYQPIEFRSEVYAASVGTMLVGGALGIVSAILNTAKSYGYSITFQGDYTVRGEMECTLNEEVLEFSSATGKSETKIRETKMRMLKLYPDYDVRFIGYNNSLVGSHSFTHKEAKAYAEHKFRGKKILQHNKESYNRLFESFVKSHENSPNSVKAYIHNHYDEFNVANNGNSFGIVPTVYGHYYGDLKDGEPLDKEAKHLFKKGDCLFVGYVKKNKREGQGTNYQFGDSTEIILTTCGTWVDGKLNGQATQDDYIHHQHFNGFYSDGYRQGKGILTDTVNNIIYEGNWNTRHRKECLNGDVVEKNLDGEILFSGKYKDNHREGGGTEHYWDGSTYRGIWKNDLKHGYGVLQIPDINATYSQIWRQGILKKGMDIERNESGEIVFNGEYKNDQRDGYGTEYQEDGNVFKGYWKKGAKHGKGVFYDMNKSYDQTWRYGILKRGRAVERNEKGDVIYEGSYRNDKRDGYGTEYYGNGCVYTGYWKSGVKHGNGTLYIPDTNESYKEEWKKGMIIKCKQL